ncbi:MAG: response regulator transcription factor [Anaerolineae bacterium]|nr:response regulator transcription factor [Anaerolineae bacterium]
MNDAGDVIRVLLVDANILFRCGIARLLDGQPDIAVVGETDNYDEAIQMALDLQPHVILVDIGFDESEAPAIARIIKRQLPEVFLIILTTEIHSDVLVGCVLAGVNGYLRKNITPQELFTRLRGVARGEAAISLHTAAILMERLRVSCTLCLRASSSPALTPRESEVLELVARGLTNRRIGAILQISEHTVRNHLCNIYAKLNLKNRLQVAVYSVTRGLVNLDDMS